MLIQAFTPVLPNTALIASADTFFSVIKQDYLDYRNRGMFLEHPEQGFFVYKLAEAGHLYLGLIAALPNEQYRTGTIKKHEGTLAASEQQQLQLLVLRDAVVKPVLLTYPTVKEIDQILERVVATNNPLLKLADGKDIEHSLYFVDPKSLIGAQLRETFDEQVVEVYIADGHHRCSTLDLYNRQLEAKGEAPIPLMAALFSSSQVRVRAYNRAVQLPVDVSPLALMAKLGDLFLIEPIAEPVLPQQRQELTMLVGDESFRLRWREEVLPQSGLTLDYELFNKLVAGPIFGIEDVRSDTRILYVPGNKGLRGMLDKVQRRPDRVGFMLYGLEAQDMFDVVDAGMIMPPKSTWFEPRMRNGLVVMEI